MQTRQQKDLEMYNEWTRAKGSQQKLETMNALVDRLNPLMQREVNKWGTTVPRPALESRARLLTVDALETYDSNRGAAVGTHVASRLRKLSRHVYPYQNVARLPENIQLKYNTFQVSQNKLMDNLGREPTIGELADDLSWSQKRVKGFQQSFGRREMVESEGAFIEKDEEDDGLVDFYYHGLSPNDQRMFEDITGYNGKKAMNNTTLMKKYKLTQGQLSYRKRKFVDKIRNIQQGRF
jgi:DNA-directed RNA polymerase specialized sigma subunit